MTLNAQLDTRAFAIGILGVTACVLLVGLLVLTQQPAYAIGMNDRGGDYIMLTQQISNTAEAVVVIDAAAKQMILYKFDYNNRVLEIVRTVALDQIPTRDKPAQQQPARRR